MLLAVLESRCGLNFSSAEVYLNIAGGYRLADPAADLAVAAALTSALADRPLPKDSVWFGEVSLYTSTSFYKLIKVLFTHNSMWMKIDLLVVSLRMVKLFFPLMVVLLSHL